MGIRSISAWTIACFSILVLVPTTQALTRASPDPPQNLRFEVQTTTIKLMWDAPSYDGGSQITAYAIYRGESPGTEYYLAETPSMNYDDMNVVPGKEYYYQVAAKNSDGEGSRSSEISAYVQVRNWTLSGKVTNDKSGEGVGDAHLRFETKDPPTRSFDTRSDGSGHYSVQLQQGNYRVWVEANELESYEGELFIDGPRTMDFSLKEKGGGMDDINLSKILGIDENDAKRVLTMVGIGVGAYLILLPLLIIIANILLLIVFIRLGKVRKELRAKNEIDGIFISKRRQKKHEVKKKETEVVVKTEKKTKIKVEEKGEK